ncbi:MAG: HesA/MoeB/ThiF family protein [Nitrososphaeria archaeon]
MSEVSAEEKIRYSRQLVLKHIGENGQLKLKRARVAIAGVGGLGGHIAVSLAGIGIGAIKIIDNDIVDLSNIHRQTNFHHNDIGKPKVEVIEERIKEVNPNTIVSSSTQTINEDTAIQFLKDADIVVDGLDSFIPRVAVNRASILNKIPYVYAGVLETYGNLSTFTPTRTGCLECNLASLIGQPTLTCETVGVLPSAVTLVASLEVNEVVNLVVHGKGLLENKLCVVDLSQPSMDIIPFYKNEKCLSCKSIIDTTRKEVSIVEVCGRNKYTTTPKRTFDFDMPKVAQKISNTYKVRLLTKNSISFDYSPDVKITLMKSGNMLLIGPKDREDALKIHQEIYRMISEI